MPENISYKRPLQAEQARSEQLALQVEMLESRVRELERSTHDPLSLQVEEIVHNGTTVLHGPTFRDDYNACTD